MTEMKLYDYTDSYNNVLSLMNTEEGVTYEDIKDTLDAISDGAEEKIANTGKVLQKLNDDLDVIKKRKAHITELQKKKERNIESLKNYLLYNMQQLNKKKVETPTITVSVRNSASMKITNMEKLPEKFKKVETIEKADVAGFKKYYKSLDENEASQIDYAELVSNQSVVVK